MSHLSPMHIINHFNITINHPQLATKPEVQTPIQKPSSRAGKLVKRQSAGPTARRNTTNRKPST
jgi:hypothetical protein